MLRRAACAVLLAALALRAGPVAVQNGDFGSGLSGWQARIAATDPEAGTLDAETSQDGNGSLRIVQRNPRSYTSFTQLVEVQPGQEYVATAWVKAERVVRRGIGANLFIGDKGGRSIALAIPARFRQGTFGWTQVAVRFGSGPRTAISVTPYLKEATGTVWFDGISVVPAPPWQGPVGPPADLSPATILPRAEAYDYRTVRNDVVTPHWAFGKPLGRRLRVAVLAPALAQRESVELAQRLDCDITPLMVHSGDSLGTTGFAYGSLSHEESLRNLKEKLKEEYDALIIGRVAWGTLTEEINKAIIEKSRAGMGLIYICPKGKRLSPDHPMFKALPMPVAALSCVGMAGLPGFESIALHETFLARHVQPYALGKGRMLVVDYGEAAPSDHHYLTPPTRRWRGGYAHYDLYMAFLGKALRWAAGTDAAAVLTGLTAPTKVKWGQPAALDCAIRGATAMAIQAELTVRRLRPSPWDPPVAKQACQITDGKATLALPTKLPAGDYVALLVLRDGARSIDWGWTRFGIQGPLAVAELDLPDRTLPGSSASVPVALRLAGEIPPGATLRFDVHDAYERLVGRQEQAFTKRVLRVDVSCAFSRSIYNRLTVHVLDADGLPLLCQHAEFTVPRPRAYDTFQFIMWGDGGDDYIGALLRRQAARSGVDAADLAFGSWQPQPLSGKERHGLRERLMALARTGIAPIPYVSRLQPDPETDSGIRQPCLTDPAFRLAFEQALDERTALCRPFSPLGITMGDENYLGQSGEYCVSPTCRTHFQTWLQSAYGTIDSLNRSWGTSLPDFAAARPALQGELARPEDWPRWVDWRRSMDRVFADTHQFGRETAQRTIQAARVGCDGLLSDTPARGYDWELLGKSCSLLNVYLRDPAHVLLLRSFAKPGDLRGCWFGGYTGERREPARQRWAPWKQIFSGLNSAWFYAPYTRVGGSGEVGFRPDLSPYDCWSATASEVDRLKSGIDRLLLTAERDDRAIALVYSRSSALVSALDPAYDEHLPALAAMAELLADAGFSFRVISATSLEDGAQLRSACQAVFLPACVALSDQAGAGLRHFAEAGGVVVADWGTGRYDEHGKRRERGALDELFGLQRNGPPGFVQPVGGIPGFLPQTSVDGSIRIRKAWPKRFVGGVPVLITSSHGAGVAVYLNFSLISYPATGGARGASLQAWLRQLLARDGLPEPVLAKGQWGAPHRVETCRWRNGELSFIGLLKHPDTPQVGEDLELALPPGQHAYDVLAGRYLGVGKTVAFHLGPGEVKLISLGPERIKSVKLERLKGDEYVTPAYRIIVGKGRRPVLSARVVHVRVFDPGGFPYRAGTVTLLAPEGSCEYDVPFGLGDPAPGRWRVEVTDAATGIRQEVAFTIRAKD